MKAASVPRRDFLKTSALATAGLSLMGGLPARLFAAEPQRKIGFALCGLGGLSTNELAPALQQTEFCRLAGIVTGTPAKAAKWKAQYNLPDPFEKEWGGNTNTGMVMLEPGQSTEWKVRLELYDLADVRH